MGTKSRLKRERAFQHMIASIYRSSSDGSVISIQVPRQFVRELPPRMQGERRAIVLMILDEYQPKSAGEFIHLMRSEGRRLECQWLIEHGTP